MIAVPVHDQVLSTADLHKREMKFRARVFFREPLHVLLLTDIGSDNPGASITNGMEFAVPTALKLWPDLEPARLVVVEHYDYRSEPNYRPRSFLVADSRAPETFDLVTFDGGIKGLTTARYWVHGMWPHPLGEVHWKPFSKDQTEKLIGGKLP